MIGDRRPNTCKTIFFSGVYKPSEDKISNF
jgi:hypothetical protein